MLLNKRNGEIMLKHGKKYNSASQQIEKEKTLSVEEALKKIKNLAYTKFDESVDVDVNLGIDPTKGEQTVRGSVLLPHARGKVPRVIVFAKGEYADQATTAGADEVGSEDLVEKIKSGWLDFDYAVATPDVMGLVGKLAKIMGPKGLLPNQKLGTVTFDVKKIVSELKKGRAFFKNDKGGSVHFSFGKVSNEVPVLLENFRAFLKALQSAKPSSSKGKYLKKIVLSSTMGVGIPVDVDELLRH